MAFIMHIATNSTMINEHVTCQIFMVFILDFNDLLFQGTQDTIKK